MSRLTSIPSRLGSAPTPFGKMFGASEVGRSALRRASTPWRRWYDSAEWRRLRRETLVAADLTCAMCSWQHPDATDCRRLKAAGLETEVVVAAPELVADHVLPHRGDADLFWSRGNLQCLCKPCHDRRKQALERRGSEWGGGDVSSGAAQGPTRAPLSERD